MRRASLRANHCSRPKGARGERGDLAGGRAPIGIFVGVSGTASWCCGSISMNSSSLVTGPAPEEDEAFEKGQTNSGARAACHGASPRGGHLNSGSGSGALPPPSSR